MTPEWLVDGRDAGLRLDKFLAAPDRLGSRGRAASALGRGKVMVNGTGASMRDAGRRLVQGDVVRIWIDRPGSAAPRLLSLGGDDLPIVYEDESLLVLNKPPGLLAVPLDRRRDAASVYDRIRNRLRSHARRKPFVVHRIDRDTSGLVVFARTAPAQAALKAQFRRREPERVYLAVVYGRPDPRSGTWRDRLMWDRAASIQKAARSGDPDAKDAVSHYRVVETFAAASLIEVRLETGKQNQIRIQACLHGHPLVGERRYVPDRDSQGAITFPRQALHAHRLGFRHPVDGRVLSFEAPLPGDLSALLSHLRRR
jgi:23S rRNA pseudouridine1911/1915/1917 synthase